MLRTYHIGFPGSDKNELGIRAPVDTACGLSGGHVRHQGGIHFSPPFPMSIVRLLHRTDRGGAGVARLHIRIMRRPTGK